MTGTTNHRTVDGLRRKSRLQIVDRGTTKTIAQGVTSSRRRILAEKGQGEGLVSLAAGHINSSAANGKATPTPRSGHDRTATAQGQASEQMIGLTYRTKFEMVQRLRRLLQLFEAFCNCGGPMPTMETSKVEEHTKDCAYRLRIEGK